MTAHAIIVDRSILPILAARIGDRAARHMMQDLEHASEDGEDEVILRLATVLGSPSVPFVRAEGRWHAHLHWDAMIHAGTHWNGSRLALDRQLPETVMQAVVGLPLSAVVVHPLLPGDRIITGIRSDFSRTIVDVAADETSAHALSGPRGFLAEHRRRWRCFDRRARHAMHRGFPVEAVLMTLLFMFALCIFILSAAASGTPGGAPPAIVAIFGLAVLGTGWMSRHLLERLMDEGAEITVLRSYHAVRTITTREEIEQGSLPNPRRHAIL